MDEGLGTYTDGRLPVRSTPSFDRDRLSDRHLAPAPSSSDDSQRLPRSTAAGPLPSAASYEAPPSPMPSPMPQMASISVDSDDLGLREIFSAESRSQEEGPSDDGDTKQPVIGDIRQEAKKEVKIEDITASDGDTQQGTQQPRQHVNGSNAASPSPKHSSSAEVAAPTTVSVSPNAPSDNVKEDKQKKQAQPASSCGSGSGGKSRSGSKTKGPPQSPPPLPPEAQLAGYRRMACKARSVPVGHTPQTAYLSIPPNAPHGMILACSHPECAASGKRFRFCAVCDIPVAKRNFLRRHSHGLMSAAGGPLPAAKHPGAKDSTGISPTSSPPYDSPASPRSASSDMRSDEEDMNAGGFGLNPNGSNKAMMTEVIVSPRPRGIMQRNEGHLDPTSPMSTGSVRQRTASDGSNRSAMGSPGKRPREGRSPPRRATTIGLTQPRAGQPLGTAPGPPPPAVARPMPLRPPPIQHCVSWPMVSAANHNHGAVAVAPMAATGTSRPMIQPRGIPVATGWSPSTPGGGVAPPMIPHYGPWPVSSPSQVMPVAPPPSSSPQQMPPPMPTTPTRPAPKRANPRPSPRDLRGPAMSFDTAIDSRRNGENAIRTFSPGLMPELQAKVTTAKSRSEDDIVLSRNDKSRGRTGSSRLEFRRHGPPGIWRGRMKSDSVLQTNGEESSQCDRKRQLSDPGESLSPRASHSKFVPVSQDDFEPPTPEISVMRLSRRERQWLDLFKRRPFEEEADALKSWMDEVLAISDPRRGGDSQDSPREGSAPRPLSEVVRHARIPVDPPREIGGDLEMEGKRAKGRGGVAGDQTENRSDKSQPVKTPSTYKQITYKQNMEKSQHSPKAKVHAPVAQERGDIGAARGNAGPAEEHSQPPPREDPENTATSEMSQVGTTGTGFASIFGCGAFLCGEGDEAGPCGAPCVHPRGVVDSTRPRTPVDVQKPLPLTDRQRSKDSVSSVNSAAVFFENTALMDIDRNTDSPFLGMAKGGSVSSASVSQIGEEDMDDAARHSELGAGPNGFDSRNTPVERRVRDPRAPGHASDPGPSRRRIHSNMSEELQVGNVSVHLCRASSTTENGGAGNMEMEAQWRAGEGVART